MLMGLRLKRGIALQDFRRIFGHSPEWFFPVSIKKWVQTGYLVLDEQSLFPADRGMNVLNSILVDLFSELDDHKGEFSVRWPLE